MQINVFKSSPENLAGLHSVITRSFKTVADDFRFTPENAPTNPAFRTIEDIESMIKKGVEYFLLTEEGQPAGCIALERDHNNPDGYFIERLAVLPEYRHRGYGESLVRRALEEIKKKNAKTAGLGIIDENTVLKDWYLKLGFRVKGTRTFDHLPFTVCFMEMDI